MKLFLGQTNPILGDLPYNTELVVKSIAEAKKGRYDLIVFSEMVLCGYTPDDLLFRPHFIDALDQALVVVAKATEGITAIVGTVRKEAGKLYNTACVITDGEIVGFQDKCLLPTYDVFDERRYFTPGVPGRIWDIAGKKMAITICEDIWPGYSNEPLSCYEGKNLDLLINLSASPYSYGKIAYRQELAKRVSKRVGCPVVLVNQFGANDGLIFDGSSFMVDGDRVMMQAETIQSATEGEELFKALVMGVRDYFYKQGFKKAVVGLSGGVDSSVVAAVAEAALGKENVLGLFMPSRFTSDVSAEDAKAVAHNLGIGYRELSIEPTLELFMKTLNTSGGITEENLQSRIRALLLMGVSNQEGSLVLNTGNKSEIAMGYTTLYGDAIGAVGVLGDLLKRQVMAVASSIAAIPERVLLRPPTAELRFNQKDSDTLPEYPILDQIVDDFIVHNKTVEEISRNFSRELVVRVIEQIHANEYKRRQLPFALRVSEKAFSVGRRVPIVSRLSACCL